MDKSNAELWAVEALAALAQDTRLRVFRMLVQAGAAGMNAGSIAERARVPASTMSHHLSHLERAGLVAARRESRLIHYTADFAAMTKLILFLMEDCCAGQPELCDGIMAAMSCQTEQEGICCD